MKVASTGLTSVRNSAPPRDDRAVPKKVEDFPLPERTDDNPEYAKAVKVEKDRQEAINQMNRLASFYAVSEESLASQEPPKFPGMLNAAVPRPSNDYIREPSGDVTRADGGPSGVTGQQSVSRREDSGFAEGPPRTEALGVVTPVPGPDTSMRIDTVAAPPAPTTSPSVTPVPSPTGTPSPSGGPFPPVPPGLVNTARSGTSRASGPTGTPRAGGPPAGKASPTGVTGDRSSAAGRSSTTGRSGVTGGGPPTGRAGAPGQTPTGRPGTTGQPAAGRAGTGGGRAPAQAVRAASWAVLLSAPPQVPRAHAFRVGPSSVAVGRRRGALPPDEPASRGSSVRTRTARPGPEAEARPVRMASWAPRAEALQVHGPARVVSPRVAPALCVVPVGISPRTRSRSAPDQSVLTI